MSSRLTVWSAGTAQHGTARHGTAILTEAADVARQYGSVDMTAYPERHGERQQPADSLSR